MTEKSQIQIFMLEFTCMGSPRSGSLTELSVHMPHKVIYLPQNNLQRIDNANSGGLQTEARMIIIVASHIK
jgi:hypothetical protein